MLRLAFVATLIGGAVCSPQAFFKLPLRHDDEPIVDLGYAKYRGNNTNEETVSYLGIPYAQPPLGELRWRAPVPLDTTEPANEVTDATEYPDFCIQGTTGGVLCRSELFLWTDVHRKGGDAGGAGSEDCLKLNIYVPKNATEGSDRECLSRQAIPLLTGISSARPCLHSRWR